MEARNRKHTLEVVSHNALLGVLAVIWLIPIIWLLCTSFSAQDNMNASTFFPSSGAYPTMYSFSNPIPSINSPCGS